MKNKKPTWQGTQYDSTEEIQFNKWLMEAELCGLVSNIKYQPRSFILSPKQTKTIIKQLKTKTKEIEQHVFAQHIYTADFSFHIKNKILDQVFPNKNKTCRHLEAPINPKIFVDVKGGFSQYNDEKPFQINRKWVYKDYGIYIHRVVPDEIFKKTWVPGLCRLTKIKIQPIKKYSKIGNIDDFISNQTKKENK